MALDLKNKSKLSKSILSMACAAFLVAVPAEADDSVRFAAVAVGVTPESLAASGCDTTMATSIMEALDSASALRQQYDLYLQNCDAANVGASGYADLLAETSLSYADREDLIADGELAKSAFESSIDDAESRRAALLAIAMNPASVGMQARIQAFHAASSYEVPDEFRVLILTADEWEALEAAIRAEAKAIRKGTTLDSESRDLLDDVRAEADVVAAKAAIDTNLSAMVIIFESY